MYRLREIRQCSRSEDHGQLGHFFMQNTCALMVYLGLVTYIPLPFDDGVLLCTTKFMAWWAR